MTTRFLALGAALTVLACSDVRSNVQCDPPLVNVDGKCQLPGAGGTGHG